MINDVLRKTWPLFLGMAFLMLGNGLQSTLISWRATYEGFASTTTSFIMSGYYVGFLVGSSSTPRLIKHVGHIRVFAALASLASASILIQVVFISPPVWFGMRLITGFCFAGAYVIVESWLNARSSNATRGRILSVYMIVSYGGIASGQWLMKVADPTSVILFILASILLSVALVPILITRTEAPDPEIQENLGIRKLFNLAPAGVVSILVSSTAHGAMFAMGAVYAVAVGMNISDTVLFMSVFIALGALSQWPIGWLSDQIDRRLVVVLVSLVATVFCALLYFMNPDQKLFYLVYGLLGAMTLPIYSIGVAHINDRLKPEQMSSASSTIVMAMGIGSIAGPISAGYLLKLVGASGYLLHLGSVHIIMIVMVAYFMLQREAVPEEDQTQYQAVPHRPTMVVLEAVAQEAEESQLSDQQE